MGSVRDGDGLAGGVLLTAVWWSGDVADDAAGNVQKTEARPPVVQLPHAGGVETFKFFADGRYLLTRSVPAEVMLWDARSGQRLGWLDDPADTLGTWRSYALAPDEKTILTGDKSGTAILWDAATAAQLQRFTGHGDNVHCVAYAPDGSSILVAGGDGQATAYSAQTGKALLVLKSPLQRVEHAQGGLLA